MTDKRFNDLMQAIKIKEDDEALLGAMPAGKCEFVGVKDEIQAYEGNNWVPVEFKAGNEVYQLSLKGLIRAEGLEYSTRNYQQRAKMWCSGAVKAGTQFEWKGKETRTGIRKRKSAYGEVGSEYTLNVYTFKNKKVG